MANDFRPAPRVKNALDNRKLNLSTPCPGVQGKWSSLIWGLYANNPRITVYTNDPNDTGADKGYGKINANLDLPVFYMLTGLITKAIDYVATADKPDWKDKVENKGFTFFGGKKSDKPAVISSVWVGKDKEGVVWISVVAKDRPIIKFSFAPSDFHNFVHGDGTPYTAGEASVLFADGYVTLLENMMTHMACNNYVEPPPRDPPAGAQRGGNSYGGGRSNGGGNSGGGMEMDDDLPF